MSHAVTRRAALVSGLALPALALPARRARAAGSLKVGVTPGAYADSVIAAAADAKARGLDVQAIEFSDWTTPNLALDSGDIDVNYFQHRPFLDNAIKARGYRFTDVGVGTLANIGLYSLKHKSFAEIPDRGSVAIADDPVNEGRRGRSRPALARRAVPRAARPGALALPGGGALSPDGRSPAAPRRDLTETRPCRLAARWSSTPSR